MIEIDKIRYLGTRTPHYETIDCGIYGKWSECLSPEHYKVLRAYKNLLRLRIDMSVH
jgi:hypothetical protein